MCQFRVGFLLNFSYLTVPVGANTGYPNSRASHPWRYSATWGQYIETRFRILGPAMRIFFLDPGLTTTVSSSGAKLFRPAIPRIPVYATGTNRRLGFAVTNSGS